MSASSFVAILAQTKVSFVAIASEAPSSAKEIKKNRHLGTCDSLGAALAGGASPRVGADGGSRTRTGSPPQDFKSCVSTGSTTSARCNAARGRCQKSRPEGTPSSPLQGARSGLQSSSSFSGQRTTGTICRGAGCRIRDRRHRQEALSEVPVAENYMKTTYCCSIVTFAH